MKMPRDKQLHLQQRSEICIVKKEGFSERTIITANVLSAYRKA